MKQKANNNHLFNNKIYLQKKSSNFTVLSESYDDKENQEKKKSDNIIKNKKKKKVKYDPFVFRMIQSKNLKKWKSNYVICVAEFLTFEECLYIRLVCKLFNDGIKNKYDFLKSNMVFSSDEKVFEKIRIEYKINNNNKKDKIDFKDIFDENTLEESNIIDKDNKDLMFNKREISNYSKKNMLFNMINNKYYMSIKYKTKKGDLFVPKNFII
jgi:hypothetical protein